MQNSNDTDRRWPHPVVDDVLFDGQTANAGHQVVSLPSDFWMIAKAVNRLIERFFVRRGLLPAPGDDALAEDAGLVPLRP